MRRLWVAAFCLLATGSRAPAAPQAAALLINDSYATMPAWDDVYNASWNNDPGQIAWTIEAVGGAPDSTGNTSYLRAMRQQAGSSVMVKHYAIPQNTDIHVGAWMRCPSNYDPSPGENYWMEFGFKIGAWNGQNFDDPATGASWFPIVKKFEYQPPGNANNGNSMTWVWYSSTAPKNSGAATTVSIGYKIGTLYNTTTYAQPPPGPDIGYDGIYISDQPMATPPAPPGGPPPGPPGPPPPGGGAPAAAGGGGESKPCGCGTAGMPGAAALAILLLVTGALLAVK